MKYRYILGGILILWGLSSCSLRTFERQEVALELKVEGVNRKKVNVYLPTPEGVLEPQKAHRRTGVYTLKFPPMTGYERKILGLIPKEYEDPYLYKLITIRLGDSTLTRLSIAEAQALPTEIDGVHVYLVE